MQPERECRICHQIKKRLDFQKWQFICRECEKQEKVCKRCLLSLPLSKFHPGRRYCKDCAPNFNLQVKKDLIERRELLSKGLRKCDSCKEVKDISQCREERKICNICDTKLQKERYAKLSQKDKENKKSKNDIRRKANPAHFLFLEARSRAKERNLPFDIEESDIIVDEFCPVLGIKMNVNIGLRRDDSPTLDKITPSLGYVKGNIKVISFRANRIKSDANLQELEKITKYVKNHLTSL